MRASLAVWLLLLTVALPAIDFLYCPDGCTDTNRSATWHTHETSANRLCGLCVNAVAVHRAVVALDPRPRAIALPLAIVPDDVAIPLRSIDRPPRRA
jgi:hypothetical protein